MFNTIKRLYTKTGNKSVVSNAVKKSWITPIQYKQIVGEDYAV